MLEVKDLPGRGRSLVCSRDVAAGDVVLEEDPTLLHVSPEHHEYVCAWCLRLLSGPFSCADCAQASFCSASCQQAAAAVPWVHSPVVCRAYKQCATFSLTEEEQTALRFLVHCYAMKHAEAAGQGGSYTAMLQALQGLPDEELNAAAAKLHPLLCSAFGDNQGAGMSVQEVAVLLAKERLNSYGIMGPPSEDGERQLRGSGIYLQASLINHECIPNVARFDNFDSSRPDNTRIAFRAMHALPAGTEVVQSYFPLNWSLQERQQQCRDVYGFTCTCPRCKLESRTGDNQARSDEDVRMDDAAAAEASTSATGPTGASESIEGDEDLGGMDETYLHLFLLKYLCPKEACFGTMAAVKGTDVVECSVCGSRRTEAQFLAELDGH